MNVLHVRAARLLIAALAVVFCYGCAAPLPDVSPFVTASAQLRAGVASGGAATESELRRFPGGDAYGDRFAKEWALRVKLCDALVRYSQSLDDIARSGTQGRESVDAVVKSAQALAAAASTVIPTAGAVGLGIDAARFAYDHIARIAASRSFEAALAAAAPGIDEVTDAMSRDILAMGALLTAANDGYQKDLAQKYSTVLGYRRQLERRRAETYARLNTDREPGLAADLQQIQTLFNASQDEFGAYELEIADAVKRRNAGMAVVRAAADAVAQWGAAHDALVVAIRDKRVVDVTSLVESTRELQGLIRRMREL